MTLATTTTPTTARSSSLSADRNPACVYVARLAPGSRRAIVQSLDMVAMTLSGGRVRALDFPWEKVTYAHVAAVRAGLAEQYSPSTVNRHLSAVRGCLKECWRLGLIDAERLARATDVRGVKGTRLPRGRALDAGEIRALFDACAADDSPAGARDAALLAVLYGAGLRRAEAAALQVEDFNAQTGALSVHLGKENKSRLVFLTNGAADAMAAWLDVRECETGALFCPVDRAGRIAYRPMTTAAIYQMLHKRADQASVARFSPHDLRRTLISELWDRGADAPSIQGIAGHSSVVTTVAYDRRGDRAKKHAAELVHVPYRKR